MYVRTNTVRNTKNTTLSEQSKDGSPPPPPIVVKKTGFVNEGRGWSIMPEPGGQSVPLPQAAKASSLAHVAKAFYPLQKKPSKLNLQKKKNTLPSICRNAMLSNTIFLLLQNGEN